MMCDTQSIPFVIAIGVVYRVHHLVHIFMHVIDMDQMVRVIHDPICLDLTSGCN